MCTTTGRHCRRESTADGWLREQRSELLDLRIRMVEIATAAVQLELQALGGRACLRGENGGFSSHRDADAGAVEDGMRQVAAAGSSGLSAWQVVIGEEGRSAHSHRAGTLPAPGNAAASTGR